MKTVLGRLVSGIVGVVGAGIALWIPLLFAAMEINELHSYDGPISIPGAVLAISAAFGFGAYKLLKLAAGR